MGHAHPVFDLGEGLFDWVEIWQVWRQEPEARARGPDGFSDGFGFVTAEIIGDDHVARPENANQQLVNVRARASAVDRRVEDAGCGELIATQVLECPLSKLGEFLISIATKTGLKESGLWSSFCRP